MADTEGSGLGVDGGAKREMENGARVNNTSIRKKSIASRLYGR